jgi:replicative DNA helicase
MIADNIIVVYQNECYNPDTSDPEILELIMAKSQYGNTGTGIFVLDKTYRIIKNLE